jgi:hypothetical protein
MMDPSEKNSFDEQWKKVFQEASETPPLSAWKGIEARLDKDEEKVVPLWWKTPRIWYAAASVAALLLVGIGLWNGSYDAKNSKKEIQIAANDKQTNPQTAASQEKADEALNQQKEGKKQSVESETTIASSGDDAKELAWGRKYSVAKQGKSLQETGSYGKNESAAALPAENNPERYVFGKDDKSLAANDFSTNKKNPVPVNEPNEAANAIQQDAASRILAEALTPIGYKSLDVYVQKRYVFFKSEPVKESAPKKSKKDEYWANVDLMPASFNPNIKVITAPSAYAFANASRQSMAGSSNPGGSYALQTQGAKRISKHWSVETGVNYLQGNSTYQGGGYLLDAATSQSENVLQSALADKAAYGYNSNTPSNSPALGAANSYSNTLYIDLNKEVRNDYRFLQVPVQAGFTLNPDKKLSYSVLGGMMANFFINNEIESAAGSVITTKAKDDVYRDLNYSATTGLRFNYRLSSKLKATLSGSYQKSLLSGFKNSETLESRPSLYGVAWGVRYSF